MKSPNDFNKNQSSSSSLIIGGKNSMRSQSSVMLFKPNALSQSQSISQSQIFNTPGNHAIFGPNPSQYQGSVKSEQNSFKNILKLQSNNRTHSNTTNTNNLIFRIDHLLKIIPGIHAIQIQYQFYKLGDPKPSYFFYTSQAYSTLTCQLKFQNKQIFKPSEIKHPYLYIEILGYSKILNQMQSFWTIFNIQSQRCRYKLPFYPQSVEIGQIFEEICPQIETVVLIRLGGHMDEIDNDKIYALQEYQIPYIHNMQRRQHEYDVKFHDITVKKEQEWESQQKFLQQSQAELTQNLILEIQNDLYNLQNYQTIKKNVYRMQKTEPEPAQVPVQITVEKEQEHRIRPKQLPPIYTKQEFQEFLDQQQSQQLFLQQQQDEKKKKKRFVRFAEL